MKRSLMARGTALFLRLTYQKWDEEKARAVMEQRKKAGEKRYELPRGIRFSKGITEEKADTMPFFTVNPASSSKKTIFYFHGGAYVSQITTHHWRFIRKLSAHTDAKIVVPLYPLAPHSTFRDAYRLLERLCEKFQDDDMIFIGDSAGGGLAAGLSMALHEKGMRLPERNILFSPWIDMRCDREDRAPYIKTDPFLSMDRLKVCAEYWAGGEDVRDFHLSPLFADTSCLKNTTVFAGTREFLFPDLMEFFEKIEKNPGCRLIVGEGMNHVWPILPIPEAKDAMEEVLKDLKKSGF